MKIPSFPNQAHTYSISLRKPDSRLNEEQLNGRQQRAEQLPQGTMVKTFLNGMVKFKKTPRQRDLETAAKNANGRRASLPATVSQAAADAVVPVKTELVNRLAQWTYDPSVEHDQAAARTATATALMSGELSRGNGNRVNVTIPDNVVVPQHHSFALAALDIFIIRTQEASGSGFPAGSSVPASQAARTDSTEQISAPVVQGSMQDRLRVALEQWVYSDNLDAPDADARRNVATRLMQAAAPGDINHQDGVFTVRVGDGLSQDDINFLSAYGIVIERQPAASGSGAAALPVALEEQADLSTPASHRSRSSTRSTHTGRIDVPENNANPDAGRTQGNRRSVLRPLNIAFGPALQAWAMEEGVDPEEREKRSGTINKIRNLIQTQAQAPDEEKRVDLTSDQIGNFSSLPPIPRSVNQVTVRVEQFPETHLRLWGESGVRILASDAGDLSHFYLPGSDLARFRSQLQEWSGNHSFEETSRTAASTCLMNFLEQGDPGQTLVLSGHPISELPPGIIPAGNQPRYVRAVDLTDTRIPESELTKLRHNQISYNR